MTQPAVSSALRRLEDEMGYLLFNRRGKWLVLNEQGKVFYDAAREFLDEIAHAAESLQAEDRPREELVIRMCAHSDRLYQLLGAFSRQNPELRIVLRQSDGARPEVFRHADFSVVMAADAAPEAASLPLEQRSTLYAILPERHPLAGREALRLTELKNEKFVFLRDSAPSGLEATYQACVNAGLRPDICMVTDTNANKYSAICRGCGIGLAFDHELSLAPLLLDCKLLPVALSMNEDCLCLTWDSDSLSPPGRQFLDFLEGSVQAYGD